MRCCSNISCLDILCVNLFRITIRRIFVRTLMDSSKTLTIRAAVKGDLTGLTPLWKMLYSFLQKYGYEFPVDDTTAQAWVTAASGQLGRFQFVWIAEVSNSVVGFLCMRLTFSPPQYGRHLIAHITELYVDERIRSRGLGRKLVEQAFAKAQELKAHSIEVQTMARNDGAISFWNKAGFASELIQFRKSMK